MKILAIETSCDETAVSVIEDGKKILSNLVASQIDIHKEFGGIVPEVAARAHTEKMMPLLQKSLAEAKVDLKNIDAIAVTFGPGLVGSLLVGLSTAKALSYSLNKKLIPINHVEAHLYAAWLEENSPPKFPALGMVVSGGHTELVLMKNHGDYQLLGATLDDAAGEAFDKVAKLLDLGYPGGPAISKAAQEGNPDKFDLPRPMLDCRGRSRSALDFSFSGLKTAVLYLVKNSKTKINKNDVAASFQKAVIDVLVEKSIRAIEKYQPKSFILGGGVAANQELRKRFVEAIHELPHPVKFYCPPIEFCTDNAAMIGVNGYFKAKAKKFIKWKDLKVDPVAEIE
ncbi:tRNA (adenosine(37)-N6)-threonylcarbamoyltransferase complex transferase subunit TsaD [Patescibacteria group bacterium]